MVKSTSPFIHLIRTPKAFYIYDVNSDNIFNIKKESFELLEKSLDAENDEIKKLKNDGFLLSDKLQRIEHPENVYIEQNLKSRVKMLTLQVTQQCNLRCKYCVYSGDYNNRTHSNKRMTFELAKKGIDFLISHASNVKNLTIGFYGGEPLLEFKLIKQCVEYALQEAEGKNVTFNMTTNATLLTDEIIQYLEKYKFYLMVSIDGPQQIHDSNRVFASNNEGSFSTVISKLQQVKERYPEFFHRIRFNAVLDSQSSFGCTNEFFTTFETLKDSFINVSPISGNYSEKKNSSTENYKISANYEMFKYYLAKLGKIDRKYSSKLLDGQFNYITKIMHNDRNGLRTNGLKEKGHPSGPCTPGTQRLFMSVDGRLYPCERVSENSCSMVIGHVDSGFDLDAIRKILNVGKLTEDDCKNCWALRYCSQCAVTADTTVELSAEKRRKGCAKVKRDVDEMLKDYCALKEFGFDFK